jgi:transmembrane protein 33
MAPPPASLPLQQRLMMLAQTLQFAWFCGHLTLLFCTLRYGLSYITFNFYSGWAVFSYRTAFLAAAVTYGIVVYKGYRSRMRAGKQDSILKLLTDENVQYLGECRESKACLPNGQAAILDLAPTPAARMSANEFSFLRTAMALIWLFSRQIPLAILPFTVYSFFHVATYTRGTLLPAIQSTPPPSSSSSSSSSSGAQPSAGALSDTIGRFVKQYYNASMTLVAILEIALWFRLLGSAILFQRGSWLLLLVYTVFFRARYALSPFVQGAVRQVRARVDALAAEQSTPPAVRQAWEAVKGIVAQVAEATDVNRYVGGGSAQGQAPKKAQ